MKRRNYLGLALPLMAVALMAACGDDSGGQKTDKPKPQEGVCSADTDCKEAGKPVCNQDTGVCEADPEAGKCSADTDCKEAGKPVCNKETGACEAGSDKPEPNPNACPDGCGDNQKCVEGQCVDGNPCTGMDCGDGLACIPVNSTGMCIDVECVVDNAVKTCDAGKVCSKGDCVYEACAKVTCTQNKLCGMDG